MSLKAQTVNQAIENSFALTQQPMKPLVCVVSIGEMLAFSKSENWGEARRQTLQALLREEVVSVDISDPRVLEAYAELSTLAQKNGWPIFHGKNDLWVGAASRATGSHLLTMDKDFLPLRGMFAAWTITVFDANTGTEVS
jgi:predicted nucleic acid-binding protein